MTSKNTNAPGGLKNVLGTSVEPNRLLLCWAQQNIVFD
jgi:hypothetical protein